MSKDSKILQQAKEMCKIRKERNNKAQEQNMVAEPKIVSTIRLNQKTRANEVAKMTERHDTAKAVSNSTVKEAEGKDQGQHRQERRTQEEHGEKHRQAVETKAMRSYSPLVSAKAETTDCRPGTCSNKKEMSDEKGDGVNMANGKVHTAETNFDHLFEPFYHPEAASSDGRKRTWQTVGKSAVLLVDSLHENEGSQRQQDENRMQGDKGGRESEAKQGQTNRIDTAKAVPNRSKSAISVNGSDVVEAVPIRSRNATPKEGGDRTETAKAVSNRSKQGEKKKGKPKYVPGPIGALIDQAAVVGLHLIVNSKDELEFQRKGRGSIPLTGWSKKAWKKK